MKLAVLALCASAATGFRPGPPKASRTLLKAHFAKVATAVSAAAINLHAEAAHAKSVLDIHECALVGTQGSLGLYEKQTDGAMLSFLFASMFVPTVLLYSTGGFSWQEVDQRWQRVQSYISRRSQLRLLRAGAAQQLVSALAASALHIASVSEGRTILFEDSIAFFAFQVMFACGWVAHRLLARS